MTASKVRANVPIPLTEESIPSQFVSFSGLPDDKEHIAILYGEPLKQDAPLVRIHSECLTGDVFGSQRCDCGEQLHEAQRLMRHEGGILLYLRQEGRGIGLFNKLDAYKLQDQGVDTYTANEMLGFPHDMRDFSIAAAMLKALEVSAVKLLSNNPNKVEALEKAGLTVHEQVETGVYITRHNADYLRAKVEQHQHRIDLDESEP